METDTKQRKKRTVDIYRTCVVCNKKVYTGMSDLQSWVYKYGKQFCCSYSCYCKANGFSRKFKY